MVGGGASKARLLAEDLRTAQFGGLKHSTHSFLENFWIFVALLGFQAAPDTGAHRRQAGSTCLKERASGGVAGHNLCIADM